MKNYFNKFPFYFQDGFFLGQSLIPKQDPTHIRVGLSVTIFFCQRYSEQKKDFHYYPYCKISIIQHLASIIQHPSSSIQHLASSIQHLAKVQKQKKLINNVDELLIKTGGDLLSRVSSTIGARGLNFCVRNGNR